jgi:hypothetical protein
MKRVDYLNKLYEKNSETGNYIIEVSLDKYGDLFNEWDNASYKKRDLDPDLSEFLDNCSRDIPLKYGIDICFYLPKEVQNAEKEKIIINRIKTYFSFIVDYESRLLKATYRKISLYIIISFILLSMGYFITASEDNVFWGTLMQGLDVGGWVFLWEAISFFFIKRADNIKRISKYKRFSLAVIFFKYSTSFSQQDLESKRG